MVGELKCQWDVFRAARIPFHLDAYAFWHILLKSHEGNFTEPDKCHHLTKIKGTT